MTCNDRNGEWPHHQDKHGNRVPCESNPCRMHDEMVSRNIEIRRFAIARFKLGVNQLYVHMISLNSC